MAGRCGCVQATFTGCACGYQSTATILADGSGSSTDPFTASAIVDSDADNNLEARSTGLYVPGPRGVLAYEEITTSQSGINPVAPIAGLSVSATLDANRHIHVCWFSPGMQSNVTADSWAWQVCEGASVLQHRFEDTGESAGANFGGGTTIAILNAPSAGVHTYFAQLARSTGGGTGSHIAAPSFPSVIWVEDKGPAL